MRHVFKFTIKLSMSGYMSPLKLMLSTELLFSKEQFRAELS